MRIDKTFRRRESSEFYVCAVRCKDRCNSTAKRVPRVTTRQRHRIDFGRGNRGHESEESRLGIIVQKYGVLGGHGGEDQGRSPPRDETVSKGIMVVVVSQ